MTILSSTTLTGVPDQQANSGQPITSRHFKNVAKDHGGIFEGITGKNADGGGGASTATPHTHIESGNRLHWVKVSQHFGSGGQEDSGATQAASSQNLAPASLSAAGATLEDVVALYAPFDVTAADVDQPLAVLVELFATPGIIPQIRATLETWGTPATNPAAPRRAYTVATPVTDSTDIPLIPLADSIAKKMSSTLGQGEDASLWCAKVVPAAAGEHTVRLNVKLGASTVSFSGIGSMYVVPAWFLNNGPDMPTKPAAPATGGAIVVVGDADNSNNYLPADDSLYAADDPLGAASVINLINSAYLQEAATGIPAIGNTGLTLAGGHAHQDPTSAPWTGKAIQYNLTGKPLGTVSSNAGLVGRFAAPRLHAAANTYTLVHREWIYTPAGVFTHNMKLYPWALVYADSAKADYIEVKFITTPEGGAAVNVQLQSTTDASGTVRYELLTDTTNTLTWKNGGRTLVEVYIRMHAAAAANWLVGYNLRFG